MQIVLPVPALITYLDALASPFSLLVATILVAGMGAAWIYLAFRFNEKLFKFKMPPFWTLNKTKEIAVEDLHDDSDDRTVIYHSPPNQKPHLNEDHNPYIRRVSRTTNSNHMKESTPQQRLRPTASRFEYSANSMPRRQILRPNASAFEFYPDGRLRQLFDPISEHAHTPRSAPDTWPEAETAKDWDGRDLKASAGSHDDCLVARRPYTMRSSDHDYKER